MTERTELWAGGRLVEALVDHGDGTGTRTTYRPDGSVDTTEEVTGLPITEPPPPPSALDRLGELPTAQAEALVTLALGIVGDAAGLWDALDQMDPGSDARPAIEIVTHHAIEAAIALLTDEQEPEP